jgi:hypothetical protein
MPACRFAMTTTVSWWSRMPSLALKAAVGLGLLALITQYRITTLWGQAGHGWQRLWDALLNTVS